MGRMALCIIGSTSSALHSSYETIENSRKLNINLGISFLYIPFYDKNYILVHKLRKYCDMKMYDINVCDFPGFFVLLIGFYSLIMGAEMVWISNLLPFYALTKSKSQRFGCIHTLLTCSYLFGNTVLYRSITSLLYELQ